METMTFMPTIPPWALEVSHLPARSSGLADSDGNVVAIFFQNGSGWHLKKLASDRTPTSENPIEKGRAILGHSTPRERVCCGGVKVGH
jgi:hypothetical protein